MNRSSFLSISLNQSNKLTTNENVFSTKSLNFSTLDCLFIHFSAATQATTTTTRVVGTAAAVTAAAGPSVEGET